MTASCADLCIASVNYSLTCEHSISTESLSAPYDSFRGFACTCPEALDIAIRIELGKPPATEHLGTLFDTGQAWAMAADDDYYYVTPDRRLLTAQESFWTARIDRDMTHVTVTCGEQMASTDEQGISITSPVTYPFDQVLLMHVLALHEGLLVHAAGVRIGGDALIFPGRSRAGKSTLSGLLAGRPGMAVLSDDRIAVRKVGDSFTAYGTPWPGDQGAALNRKAGLRGMCFLRHADTDRIAPLTPDQALERLFPVASVPWYDRDVLPRVLQACDDLVTRVPAYDLHFRPDVGVVELVRELG